METTTEGIYKEKEIKATKQGCMLECKGIRNGKLQQTKPTQRGRTKQKGFMHSSKLSYPSYRRYGWTDALAETNQYSEEE